MKVAVMRRNNSFDVPCHFHRSREEKLGWDKDRIKKLETLTHCLSHCWSPTCRSPHILSVLKQSDDHICFLPSFVLFFFFSALSSLLSSRLPCLSASVIVKSISTFSLKVFLWFKVKGQTIGKTPWRSVASSFLYNLQTIFLMFSISPIFYVWFPFLYLIWKSCKLFVSQGCIFLADWDLSKEKNVTYYYMLYYMIWSWLVSWLVDQINQTKKEMFKR